MKNRSQSTDVVKLSLEVGEALGKVEEGMNFDISEMVYACIRPENLKWSMEPIDGFQVQGVVKEQIYVGNIIKSNIVIGNGQTLKLSRMDLEDIPKVGALVQIYWDLKDVVLMKSRAHLIHNVIENVNLGGA